MKKSKKFCGLLLLLFTLMVPHLYGCSDKAIQNDLLLLYKKDSWAHEYSWETILEFRWSEGEIREITSTSCFGTHEAATDFYNIMSKTDEMLSVKVNECDIIIRIKPNRVRGYSYKEIIDLYESEGWIQVDQTFHSTKNEGKL